MTRRILILFASLLSLLLMAPSGCGPQPTPNPPPNPPAAQGGTVGAGGSVGLGGTPAEGGSSAVAGAAGSTVAAVVFPACSETMRAPMRVRPPMSGWHKDKSRAKHRKTRPSYQLVPGAESVFRAPNFSHALDQGSLGSCTGNAVAHALSTHPFTLLLTEDDAVKIYRRATVIDPFPGTYPPTDTGSNGASAWQAAIDLGYTSVRSTPIESLEELQTALQRVSCLLGTDWYDGFFEPTKCGEMAQSGAIAGGHEIEILGWDKQLKRVWIRNSWGDWGVSRGEETGYAYFSAGTLQKLLNAGAEIDCPASPQN
jgi:hypothetical protein